MKGAKKTSKLKEDTTEPVRIDKGVLGFVRAHKELTGLPIQRFLEDAIMEKVSRLPEDIQEKIVGAKKLKSA